MDDPLSPNARGGDPDEGAPEFHPEVVAFARWFVDWWLRRGLRLVLEAEAEAEEGDSGV
jgi:hypothetical protein